MNKNIKVLFTGGGSAGHVTPSFPIIDQCREQGAIIFYCGSKQGIERALTEGLNIPYYAITTGKLRRYWTWKNFLTPFQLIIGVLQSFFLLRKLKPDLVFSKGGFVALPVVIAARINRIPVMIHESDLTPGLTNRLSFPFAQSIAVSFSETAKQIKDQKKILVSGTPIRPFLYFGNKATGLLTCGFNKEKPVLLIMAGGLGSESINQTIHRLLKTLTQTFQVIHLCGKGKLDQHFSDVSGYKQIEYAHEELADLLACSDLVVSRAGANSIFELLALKKPHLLLPLSAKASRGDQIQNARYFEQKGLSVVLYPEEFSDKALLEKLSMLYKNLPNIKAKLDHYKPLDSLSIIMQEFGILLKN